MHTIKHNGKNYVIVEAEVWEALVAGRVSMPKLPAPDSGGNVPAVAFARATIARRIIRDRTALGLSQARLAGLAGIRAETLNRIEKGKVTLDEATAVKIEKALVGVQKATPIPPVRGAMNARGSGRHGSTRRKAVRSA
jgi:DNA-binding XRE family transcriptional regulator